MLQGDCSASTTVPSVTEGPPLAPAQRRSQCYVLTPHDLFRMDTPGQQLSLANLYMRVAREAPGEAWPRGDDGDAGELVLRERETLQVHRVPLPTSALGVLQNSDKSGVDELLIQLQQRLVGMLDEERKKAEAGENKFLSGTAGSLLENNDGYSEPVPTPSRPIASLFTDTTVFFADIQGFTAWSSARSPTEVFELLEAIYSAFDAIASKRGVYKVSHRNGIGYAMCYVL